MTGHYRRARARLDRLASDRGNQSPLHPQYVAATVDRLAADDAIFTFDVGTPSIWAARYLRMNGTRRLVGSFNHGSMANALPHAIGAQASHPGRQVVGRALFDMAATRQTLPFRPRSPPASSRGSPSTRPGSSCPAEAASSSSSPGPTCENSISNEGFTRIPLRSTIYAVLTAAAAWRMRSATAFGWET